MLRRLASEPRARRRGACEERRLRKVEREVVSKKRRRLKEKQIELFFFATPNSLQTSAYLDSQAQLARACVACKCLCERRGRTEAFRGGKGAPTADADDADDEEEATTPLLPPELMPLRQLDIVVVRACCCFCCFRSTSFTRGLTIARASLATRRMKRREERERERERESERERNRERQS